MKRSRRTLTPMEDLIHEAIVQLLRFKADPRTIYLHVPNGIPCTKIVGARFKRLGMLAGAPDLLVIPPGGLACFLEVKSPAGTLSEAQVAFKARCEAAGVPYAVVRSSMQAETQLALWGALRGKHEYRSLAA